MDNLVADLGIVLGNNFLRVEDRVRFHRGIGTKTSKTSIDLGQEGWGDGGDGEGAARWV
jgi:hypothetical protein